MNFDFLRNKKGQEDFIFKLLVGAVIGAVILGIILVLIEKTENQKVYLSNESLVSNIKYAVKAPTGEPYVIDKVIIPKETYFTFKYFEEETGLTQDCLVLNSNKSVFKKIDSGLVTQNDVETKVTITCNPNVGNCPIHCEILFG
ncbi:MAG: hypothetical protein PHH82_02040 [Candidatus ainarchaeum sp.]|nr:hypothetical protein [Candidatus ainarchaeum sp.]